MIGRVKAFAVAIVMLIAIQSYSTCVWAFTPDEITSLKQIGADEDMVEISWKNTGADSYVVQYSANETDWTKAVGETRCTTNKVSIYNRVAGMTYYIRVKAIYKVEKPVEQKPTDGGDKVTTNSSEQVSGNASDETEEITTEQDDADEKITTNPADSGENKTQVVTYESKWSNIIDVVTTPKKNITIVQTGATKNSAQLKWDCVAGATSYNIYKKHLGKTIFFKNVKVTNVNVTGLGTTNKTDIIVAPVRTSKIGFSTECYNVIQSENIKLQPGKINSISFSAFNPKSKKATLVYGKQEGTTGADIQVFTLKGKKPLWKGSTTDKTKVISKIKANTFYKVRMRAYTIIAGQKKYGSWSDTVYFGNQVSVELKMNFNKIGISWKKFVGADSYTVYASDDNVTYKKVNTVKKTSTKISKVAGKKVKSGKDYYVYVVANKKANKKIHKSFVKNSFFLAVR